jgi:hypothetical protein
MAEAQPSDTGFGYINNPSRQPAEVFLTPASSLKSAIKVPETLGQKINNLLSLTFKKEQILKKHEKMTRKEQARDLVRDETYYKIV